MNEQHLALHEQHLARQHLALHEQHLAFLQPRPAPQLPPTRPVPHAVTQAPSDSALNHISLEYPYEKLQQATGNFAESNSIGAGSYGGVYKGVLMDGTEVAIKVLDVPDEAGFEEEVKVLSKFRHPNLVILMGFARHGTQRSLVYELLAGGDVHKRLHRSCVDGVPFPWTERVSIALDAACGLSHLHHSSPKVFHRDIKTPNILLDKNGTAKMADFGLACLSHASAHRVKQASGTVGYACPLYVQRGVVTEGSEVYSFGMVLLELLTASPPAYVGNGGRANEIQYLANHIKDDINIVLSLVDTKAQWTPPAARFIAEFALKCINMQEEKRPNFAEIVRTTRSVHDGSALAALAAKAEAYAPAHRAQPPGVVPGQQPAVAQSQVAGRSASPRPHLPHPGLQQAPPALQRYASPPARGTVVAAHRQGSSSPGSHGSWQGYQPQPGGCPAPFAALDAEKASVLRPPPLLPEMQPNLLTQQAAASLFTLECIFSEGINLKDVPFEQRLIDHRLASEDDAVCSAPLPPLRVGRIFQTGLFDALVADPSTRSTISREHFQVWAEEAPSPPISGDAGDSRIPCSFYLTNFSGNGTHVNDNHLQVRGERAMLRHGDVITLSRSVSGPDGVAVQGRFIQLRFDLSKSCLREAEWFCAGDSPRGSESSGEDAECMNSPGSENFEGELAFILEVCGPAVQEVPIDRRRLAFSPPIEQNELYSALLVGRAHQLDFWQEVLHLEAFNTLSRQHFEVQTWRSVSSNSEASFSFLVRNLSDVNPIHVRGGPEDTLEEINSSLAKGEQRHLLDGDEIVLNLDQENTFWLIFRDLTKSTAIERLASPGCRHYYSEEDSSGVDLPVSSKSRQGYAASVLRPPVSLLMMKDEDEISTTATPLDLLHDEPDEDEEDDDDATHIGVNPRQGGGHSSWAPRPRVRSQDMIGHGGGSLPGAREYDGYGSRRISPGVGAAGMLPKSGAAPALVRDSRGVREDQRRNPSPNGPVGSHYARAVRDVASNGHSGFAKGMSDAYRLAPEVPLGMNNRRGR